MEELLGKQPKSVCLEASFVVLIVPTSRHPHITLDSSLSHPRRKTQEILDVFAIFQTSPQPRTCLFLPSLLAHFFPLAAVFTQRTNRRRCWSDGSGVLNNNYTSYPVRGDCRVCETAAFDQSHAMRGFQSAALRGCTRNTISMVLSCKPSLGARGRPRMRSSEKPATSPRGWTNYTRVLYSLHATVPTWRRYGLHGRQRFS